MSGGEMKKLFSSFSVCTCLVVFLAVPCSAQMPTVVLQTNFGDIVVELDDVNAPVTVENFIGYINSGFYDGLIFHRITDVDDNIYVIQGGGFDPDLREQETGGPIINESNNGLSNVRGSIAMARRDDPNSATSQFYINYEDNLFLDWESPSKPQYCVFGRVISDMNVVDNIAATPTGTGILPDGSTMPDVPNSPVIIYSAHEINYMYDILGNLDGDNNVDGNDFAVLASTWLDGETNHEFNRGIETDTGGQHDLDGDIFVWKTPGNNIYGYNLSTGQTFAICTAINYQNQPAVSGNIVVWRDYRNYHQTDTNGVKLKTDIYAADILDPNNPVEMVISKASDSQMTPAIDDNIIVFDTINQYGDHGIYSYNLITQAISFISDNIGDDQQKPAISGNIAVWQDYYGGNWDIYGDGDLNSDTDSFIPICTVAGSQLNPSVDANIVIWEDYRYGEMAIYGYDIGTETEFMITQRDVVNFDIDDGIVVWQDRRNGQWDIYGYDIAQGLEFPVCIAEGDQTYPVISNETVAWLDSRNISNDLYWRNIDTIHLAGDVNGDGKVDIKDLAVLVSSWLENNAYNP